MSKLTALKEKYFPPDASYSIKDQLGYCGGAFGNTMGQDIATSYADKFARKYLKIEAKKITLFDNVAMAVGFLSGAVSGYILDTPAKPDKQSPVKRICGITPLPIAIAAMLLFIVPSNNPMLNFAWKAAFHLIFNISDIFYDASLTTLSLRVATDAKDRRNFYTVGQFAATLGSMLPGWLIPPLISLTNDDIGLQKRVYFITSLVFCVIGVIAMFAPYFMVKEKVRLTERPEQEKLAWNKQTVLAILHNRTFIITEIGTFFEQVRQISYKLLHYLYEDVFNAFWLDTPMGALSGTLAYIGLLSVPFLNKRFPARTIISGGFAYTGVFFSLIGLLGSKRDVKTLRKLKVLIGILIGFSGMPNAAISASKRIMVGDSIDYMEWYSEKTYGQPIHAEGFISSIQSVCGNVFSIICTNMYDFGFHRLDYRPTVTDALGKEITAVQSEKTLRGIFRMFVWFGVIGNFLAAASFLFDRYTGKRKEEITAELADMRARRQLAEEAAAAIEEA